MTTKLNPDDLPSRDEVMNELHDVVIARVTIPKETLRKFLDAGRNGVNFEEGDYIDVTPELEKAAFDCAMGEQNQEVRTALLGLLCINSGGDFTDLITRQGYQFVDKSTVDDDYEFADIMSFPFGDAKTPILVLKLINRTIEPGAETATEEERLSRGLTKEGYKIYILGITDQHVQPYVTVKHGKNKGTHKLTNRLIPAKDRTGTIRYPRSWWERNEDTNNLTFSEESVKLRSKLDFVGYTFGLYPGEYAPDVEA